MPRRALGTPPPTAAGTHPTAVFVEYHPLIRDNRSTPVVSARMPIDVDTHTAPITAFPYSAFHGVGRDAAHATPHRWHYISLAIQSKLAVAGWPFKQGLPAPAGSMVIKRSADGMNPMRTYPRVLQPRAISRSTTSAQAPPVTYAPQYAKII